MTIPRPSSRLRTIQWVSIVLVTLVITINYIDRSTLAVGNLLIRKAFGLNATEIGALQSAWSLSYAFVQIPVGFMLDRLGPRYLVGGALIVWSLAQGAGGLAMTYAQLLWTRIGLGIAESPAYPAGVRITSDWFHARERGSPTGLYNSAGNIGPAIAPPLLTALMLAFGWRAMFVTMGAVGIVGSLIWFLLYRNPHKTALSENDMAYLAENRLATTPVSAEQWSKLFGFRTTWALILLAFCMGYSIWMYQTWIPGYLEMAQHISIKRTGILASVPLVCGIVGCWVGGWFSDALGRWGMSLVGSRKAPCIVGMLLSGFFTAITTQAATATQAVVLISLSVFFLMVSVSGKWALTTAAAPQSYCTSLAGLMNFGGYIGGTVSPIATGFVVDTTGSFVIAFAIGAALTLVGAVILMVLLRAPITSEDLVSPELVPGTAD
ncbi:MAG TPA: MFS transporter [Acidisoma sp.]|jgi:sugar phosphate permease|uniref:MFS transporter n=1 Tax=Acidisoma sp. TaxID=1872115 RepID=UPI002C5E5083|nr:MFS transporter [Acidisoma sp.]HTI02883.1 MFS transporter [Acidisoma sp.]